MRVQVNLSDEMVAEVDKLAKRYGVTRSGLCCTLIGQGVASHTEAFALMQNKELLAEMLRVTDSLKGGVVDASN